MAYLKSCKVTFSKAKRIQFWLSVYLSCREWKLIIYNIIIKQQNYNGHSTLQICSKTQWAAQLHLHWKKPVPEGITIRIFDKAGNPRMPSFCLYVECSKSIQKFPKQTARQLTRLWNRVSVEHCLIWPIVAVRCCWIHIHCLPCLLPWSLIVCQSS